MLCQKTNVTSAKPDDAHSVMAMPASLAVPAAQAIHQIHNLLPA
jgi:hypothetical protein